MSVHDPSVIKVGNSLNLEVLVSELQLVGGRSQSSAAGAASSATTSYVTANSTSFTVAADDLVLWMANVQFSISDGSASRAAFQYFLNGSVSSGYVTSSSISSTGGDTSFFSQAITVQDLTAGTNTFETKVRVYSGSGTIYVNNSYQWFVVMKRKTA